MLPLKSKGSSRWTYYPLGVVEMRGVEPLSENISAVFSPGASDALGFAVQPGRISKLGEPLSR